MGVGRHDLDAPRDGLRARVGSTWVERFPTSKPSARFEHTLACDTARGRVVLFGGYGALLLGDTWEQVKS